VTYTTDIEKALRKPLQHYVEKAFKEKKPEYMLINLRGDQPERLHRLVWMLAHGPIPDGYQVHHIDGQRWNNSLDNLELMTISEHTRIHSHEKIGAKRSLEARLHMSQGQKKRYRREYGLSE
jgi:hypothetical protein